MALVVVLRPSARVSRVCASLWRVRSPSLPRRVQNARSEEEHDGSTSPCCTPSPATPLHDDQADNDAGGTPRHIDAQAARTEMGGADIFIEASDVLQRPIVSDRPAKISRTTVAMHEAQPSLIDEAQLQDLLELADDGIEVVWPTGWNESLARAQKRERPPLTEPAPKKVRVAQLPECTTSSGSTPAVVQQRNAAPPLAAPKAVGPAPSAAFKFGSGHNLRRNGRLIWCRKCGRYGEERFRPDGLGGPCRGPSVRNASQFNLLCSGRHPVRRHLLPREQAYVQ